MASSKQTFDVLNVKCGGCASTLKKKLFDTFGEVEVDLEKQPRQITLEISEAQVDVLRKALKEIGYPMASEEMGFIESGSLKAKSFISCAIGKMDE